MKQSTTKISTVLQRYLKRNRRIEESTAKMTEMVIGYLINSAGDMPVSDLELCHAERFQGYLLDKGLRKVSVNSYTKTASPVFSWAVREGYAEQNPFSKLKKFKVARKRVKVFSAHEIERLLRSCPNDIWAGRILCGLTSMRKSEVLNLTVQDIDFEHELIYVQPKDDSAYTWRWHPKDYEQRALPLIPAVRKILYRRYEKLVAGMPYLLIKPERYSYLLGRKDKMTDRQRKCPDNNFNRTFKNICKRAFVNGNFHQLRKTSLTELSSGLRLQEVQELAGHSSIETTRAYLATRSDVLTRANDILSRGVAQFG